MEVAPTGADAGRDVAVELGDDIAQPGLEVDAAQT
jgi:hypothetical protein